MNGTRVPLILCICLKGIKKGYRCSLSLKAFSDLERLVAFVQRKLTYVIAEGRFRATLLFAESSV